LSPFELLMVKCSKCGNEAEGTAEHGEHLKAKKHLPTHSQPEHTEYTAYQDQRMTEIEKRLDKLEGK
jgi:hypothetical protein